MRCTSSGKHSIPHFRSKCNSKLRKEVKDLYKKYEKLCVEHKKSSYQVAKETGIAQSTLSDWKAGRSNPKIDKLKIIADYFGVSIEYFLEDTTQPVQ